MCCSRETAAGDRAERSLGPIFIGRLELRASASCSAVQSACSKHGKACRSEKPHDVQLDTLRELILTILCIAGLTLVPIAYRYGVLPPRTGGQSWVPIAVVVGTHLTGFRTDLIILACTSGALLATSVK
jgi:hypothetical protein